MKVRNARSTAQHSKSKTISDFTVSRAKTHFMSLQEPMYNKTNGTASGMGTDIFIRYKYLGLFCLWIFILFEK